MELATFTTTQLAVAFNAITDSKIKKFENRQKAEARVAAALNDKGLGFDAIAAALEGRPLKREDDAVAFDTPEQIAKPSLVAIAEAVEAGEVIPVPAQETVEAPRKSRKEGSKRQMIMDMVLREGGATEAEICEAIGWKACLVTLRRVCEAEKITLVSRKEEGSRKSRYYGSR